MYSRTALHKRGFFLKKSGITALFILPFFLSAACLSSPSDVPKPYAPDSWLKVETDHFIIYSNNEKAETFKQVSAIEQFRFFMESLLPASMQAETGHEQKLRLFILKDDKQLYYVRAGFPSGVVGVYFSCQEGSSAYSTIQKPSEYIAKPYRTQDQSQITLFHEYTHYMMARKGLNHYPEWYIEGLAEYYSTLEYDGKHIAIGTVPLDENIVLNQVNWGNFETVLAPDKKYSSGLTGSRDDLVIFYAKSWLLTHYMMSSPERRAQLEDYFTRLSRGEPSVGAFEAATHISVASLPGILRTYSKALPVTINTVDEPPKLSGDVTELDDIYDSYLLLGSVIDTCPSRKHGEWLLKTLKLQADKAQIVDLMTKEKSTEQKSADEWALDHAETVASNIDYKLIVAYAEILYGDSTQPRNWLDTIPQTDEHYGRAQYLLGRSYLASAEKADKTEKAKALDQAYKALSLANSAMPDDAPTQFFLAKSLMDTSSTSDKATSFAFNAYQLAPSVYSYAELSAFLSLRSGDRAKAIQALSYFKSTPHDPEGNKRVADAIDAINAGKSADDVWGIMHKEAETDASLANTKK